MLTAYALRPDGLLEGHTIKTGSELGPQVVWVDLVAPEKVERQWVLQAYGRELPSEDAVEEIEASSRFFKDDNGLHLRSFFLQERSNHPRNLTVAFIITEDRLYTIRGSELATFESFATRAARDRDLVTNPTSILLQLFEIKVDRLADSLEALHTELEDVGRHVFRTRERELENVMTRLARAHSINDEVRLSLRDKQRALSFLLRARECPSEEAALLHEVLEDIESLNGHSTFLLDKMSFLMDASLGLINVEQNKVIKIFSIAAVVFLPPTLVASIYGMNFPDIPELSWPYGYPFSLAAMVGAGGAVYWYFKRKGWL